MKNIINQVFGQWTVLEKLEKNGSGNMMWKCICSCGTLKNLSGSDLRIGKTTKCIKCRAKGHEVENTLDSHELYATWWGMKMRCYNKTDKNYNSYGERGITVCQRWLESFENFCTDMGKKPSKKHSVDRIDVNGDYEPNNCRWATPLQQSNNKRNNVKLMYEGNIYTISELSRKTGVNKNTIQTRRNKGASVEEMIYGFK